MTYNPVLQPAEGFVPFSRTYALTVQAPSNLPSGSTTVNFAPQVNTAPSGVSNSTALSYVAFAPTSLTFTFPGQVQTVNVTMAVPAGAVTGAYGYQIYTQGWPTTVSIIDFGAALNMTLDPPSTVNPPTVTIGTPNDGQVFTYPYTSLPATIPYTFTASATAGDPILSVASDVNGIPLVQGVLSGGILGNLLGTLTGLGTAAVNGGSSILISAPGTYVVTAHATNDVGDAVDINTFTVVVTAPPPTVAITSPAANAVYTYKTGSAPLSVPITFVGTSTFGGVRTLTATLDGAPFTYTVANIGSLVATGTGSVAYTTGGTHTISSTVTDDYGTATTTSTFTVNVLTPTPTIVITTPANGATFTLPTGATTMSVPFTFNTGTTTGFTVDSVSAAIDGNAATITTTTGLGTVAAVSNGTLASLAAGTHTLAATGISAGISVSTSVTFTVQASATLPPPTVVINTPAAGSTYTIATGGAALSIPMTFTGNSTTAGVGISKLTATLDGVALTVTATSIGQPTANGSSTMTVSTAGTHTISVTATDSVGTATATRTFTVTAVTPRNICGSVFFDTDCDGTFDCFENGLSNFTVKLLNSAGAVVATATTDCRGNYCFTNIIPGSYTVSVVTRCGFVGSPTTTVAITLANANLTVAPIGLKLNYTDLCGTKACGHSSDYWRLCLDKSVCSNSWGCNNWGYSCWNSCGQTDSRTLSCYTNTIACLPYTAFKCLSLKSADGTESCTSSSTSGQLCKEALGSHYNYCNGAYINGDKDLTYCFIQWCGYVTAHQSLYTSTQLTFAKNWCAAYNQSNGGCLNGPSS